MRFGRASLPLQLAREVFRQAETAGFGNAFGQLVYHHVVINAIGGGVAGEFRLEGRLLAFLQDLTQEYRLEGTADLGDFILLIYLSARGQVFQWDVGEIDVA